MSGRMRRGLAITLACAGRQPYPAWLTDYYRRRDLRLRIAYALMKQASLRFDDFGSRDERGAAFWDVYTALLEDRLEIPDSVPPNTWPAEDPTYMQTVDPEISQSVHESFRLPKGFRA